MSTLFNTLNILPPGKYFVGDPCYAVPNGKWNDLLDATGYLGLFKSYESMCERFYSSKSFHEYDGDKYGMWMFEGFSIGASGTMHGDGGYFDEDGNNYDVDSGTLGVVPIEFISFDNERELNLLGKVVDFYHPFTVSYTDDGVVHIGHIHINTNPQYSDYYDEEEEDYDYQLSN